MEAPDSFFTLREDSDIEIKIKGSKFLGHGRHCRSEEAAGEIIGSIRRQFHDATHNCFAYRVGLGSEMKFRYSDDGEPSGTAGKPILDRVDGHRLTDTLVVVTRYFGGTKLGTGGLARAYAEAAERAIEEAGVIEEFITEKIGAKLAFPEYNPVERAIRQLEGRIVDSKFSDIIRLVIEIRRSKVDKLKSVLADLTSGRIEFEEGD
jgi:uncharacterized YigZ family protein